MNKIKKYELPSGEASIEGVVRLYTEKDYTMPITKKKMQAALMESLYVNLEQQQEIAELKAMVNALSSPSCDGDTGGAVNDAGWWLSEWLSDRGEINGYQFNDLKPMFCEAVKFYANKLREQR